MIYFQNNGFFFTQKNDSIGMTKRSYMEAVMEGLRAVSAVDVAFPAHNVDAGSPTTNVPVNDVRSGTTRKKIYVRLLLSIDRRESTAAAMETVCLYILCARIFLSSHILQAMYFDHLSQLIVG